MRRNHRSLCQPLATSTTSSLSSASTKTVGVVPDWKTVSRRAQRRAHQIVAEGLDEKFGDNNEPPRRFPRNRYKKKMKQQKATTQLANVIQNIKHYHTPTHKKKHHQHQSQHHNHNVVNEEQHKKETIKKIVLMANDEIDDEEEQQLISAAAMEQVPLLFKQFEQQISHINDSARNNVSHGSSGIPWYDEYSLRKRRGHHRYHHRLTLATKSRRNPSPPGRQHFGRNASTSLKSQHIAMCVNHRVADQVPRYSFNYDNLCRLVRDLASPTLYRRTVRMRYWSSHRSSRPSQSSRAQYRANPRRMARTFIRGMLAGGRLHGDELMATLSGRYARGYRNRNAKLKLDLS